TTPVSADVTGVVVARIRPRTAAAAAGLTRGDRVLAINGHRLRDAIDFQFHAGEPELELRVERDGTLLTLPPQRRRADPGGGRARLCRAPPAARAAREGGDPHARPDRALPGPERRPPARAHRLRPRPAPPQGGDDRDRAGRAHASPRAAARPPEPHR